MRFKIHVIAASILCIGVGGCASDNELRQAAKMHSIYIEKVKSDAIEFSDARDRVAKARLATLHFLQATILASEQAAQTDLSARVIAQDTKWLALYDALQKAPDLVVKQRQERMESDAAATAALAKAKGAVDIKHDKLTEASSALATLSEEHSKREDAAFFVSYLKEVNTALCEKKKAVNAASPPSNAASAPSCSPK